MFAVVKSVALCGRLTCLALAAMMGLIQTDAFGNTQGGWTPLVNTPVTTGTEAFSGRTDRYLDNGILHVLVSTNGSVDSIKYLKPGLSGTPEANGVETVSQSGVNFANHTAIYYYWDPDGNGPCIYLNTITSSTNIDIGYIRKYATNDSVVADVELRYSLGQGNSGMYAYIIMHHLPTLTNTPIDLSTGFIQCLWPTAHDTVNFLCENSYVDDNVKYGLVTNGVFQTRAGLQPNFYDNWHQIAVTNYNLPKEVTEYTTGIFAGSTNCKYSYTFDYPTYNSFGMASDINKIGLWFVAGGHEYQNCGPTANEYSGGIGGLITFEPLIAHYGNVGLTVKSNTVYNKVYGPWMFYINSQSNGTACWADSKQQGLAEQAAWPYAWLTNIYYQALNQRAVVSGKLVINDPLRPQANAASAWVGFAAPDAGVENSANNWQLQSDNYQFWTQCAADGSFTLPPVTTVGPFGTNSIYELFAYCAGTNGSVGEFRSGPYAFAPGTVTNLGTLTWNVTHTGNSVLWEIGIPDRSAEEFRHGNDYPIPGLDLGFAQEFPQRWTYTVGSSSPRTNWNYVQSAYFNAGTISNMYWTVQFVVTNVPATGNAMLNIAWAGAYSAAIRMWVNNISAPDTSYFADFYPNVPSGANTLVRLGIHDKYGIDHVTIPVNKLVVGTNTITLSQRRAAGSISTYVMYDYLDLEMPTPITPPNPTAAPGDSKVMLNWTAAPGATGYNVRSSTSSGGPFNWIGTNVSGVTFTNTGLANGTLYYYTVSATNSAGESGMSFPVSARPVSGTPPQINPIPAPPTNLRVTWPQANTGWMLQVETNSLDTGIGTNWVSLTNSVTTNDVTIPLNNADGSVFYRLIYQ